MTERDKRILLKVDFNYELQDIVHEALFDTLDEHCDTLIDKYIEGFDNFITIDLDLYVDQPWYGSFPDDESPDNIIAFYALKFSKELFPEIRKMPQLKELQDDELLVMTTYVMSKEMRKKLYRFKAHKLGLEYEYDRDMVEEYGSRSAAYDAGVREGEKDIYNQPVLYTLTAPYTPSSPLLEYSLQRYNEEFPLEKQID